MAQFAPALEKPLPKPRRDLLGYVSARVLEALLEGILALEFLERGYTTSKDTPNLYKGLRSLTPGQQPFRLLASSGAMLPAAVFWPPGGQGPDPGFWRLER